MDWKNSRIDALLERALTEDKAAGDTTTNLTIDPHLRATGSIVARQEMVGCGPPHRPRAAQLRARDPESHAASERHRHADAQIR